MKLKLYHILFPFLLIVILSVTSYIPKKTELKIDLITKKTAYTATQAIELKFTSNQTEGVFLYCNNSYSSTILSPEIKNDSISFTIPNHFTKKTGLLKWSLIFKTKYVLTGEISVTPSNSKTHVEAYFGPRSILAGGNDFSMLVVVPSDSYDNPVKEGTDVFINHQFLSSVKTDKIPTKNLIAWKNINSYKPSGRILVNALCNNSSSKELTTIVYPNNPVNFKIKAQRDHDFADGNQVSYFITSTIKDQYNNIISDGTLVEFTIKNKQNILLKTYSTTINGVAKAKMLHPDHEEVWRVSAIIPGMAESNTIQLKYKQVLKDFDIEFTNNNRIINVGLLTSFMKQPVADGFIVKLNLYKNDSLIETKIKTSYEGMAAFKLSKDFYESGVYNLAIESGGITKEFLNTKLDE